MNSPEIVRLIVAVQKVLEDGMFTSDLYGDNTPMPYCKYCGKGSWGECDHEEDCPGVELQEAYYRAAKGGEDAKG